MPLTTEISPARLAADGKVMIVDDEPINVKVLVELLRPTYSLIVARDGAQMILAPSIDFASVADVRAASTAFRAIENRVAMVKADVAWDSVIVAPNGRVVASTAEHAERGGQALLVADVALGPRGAPFTRFGGVPFQWLTYGAALLLIGAMEVSWRLRRTARKAEKAANATN